jgi:hypothetical protein
MESTCSQINLTIVDTGYGPLEQIMDGNLRLNINRLGLDGIKLGIVHEVDRRPLDSGSGELI